MRCSRYSRSRRTGYAASFIEDPSRTEVEHEADRYHFGPHRERASGLLTLSG